jgi:ribosomal protein S18 acetylase RimI-like enzyme
LKFEIRKAKKDDLDTIKAVACHTIDRNYRSFLGDEGVNWFINGPSDDYIEENIDICSVILVDGEVVGFSVCNENLIDLMMVNHEEHRKGIGTKLLHYCEEALFAAYDEIKVESFENNEKANNFYRKNGWKNITLESDPISGYNKHIFMKSKKV